VLAHGPVGVNAAGVAEQPFRDKTVGEVVKLTSGKIGEAMSLNRYARFTAKAGAVESYLHHNGQVGVLVELEGPKAAGLSELGREVALHIASADPVGVNESDLPAEMLERERRIAEEQVAAEGKPENIRGKIVEGKLKKFVAERTLVAQPFVKDESKTIGDLVAAAAKALGAPIRLVRFARFKVGEG